MTDSKVLDGWGVTLYMYIVFDKLYDTNASYQSWFDSLAHAPIKIITTPALGLNSKPAKNVLKIGKTDVFPR